MTIPTKRFLTLGLRGRAVPERMRVDRGGNILYESVFTPRRVRGHEAIGQLFEYRIEAVTTHPAALRMAAGGNDERIRLDDGQLVEGVSSEHGETSLVLSQDMQVAEVHLLRNDGSVIATYQPMLTRVTDTAFKSQGSTSS
ncbi:hypothetical protein PWP93_31415 [Paraburkholderia sp. A1RI-2L]|uniref:hypothetical protein n=1 Tax=Paraburkholderia sp. A1RI-2L TaxID=3028367 RepID=UPI003B81E180